MGGHEMDAELLRLFHDEAEDLLDQLERRLLALEADPDEHASLDECFGLLHTIKGTCSMYGFGDASGLAHEVETLFDRARCGALPITQQLIDIALSAKDALAALVSGSEQEATRAREITQVLLDSMQGLSAEGVVPSTPHVDDDGVRSEGQTRLEVAIHPRGDLFMRGVSITGVLRGLAELGETSVEVDWSQVPALGSIDPEQCYFALRVDLLTESSTSAVRDALMFLDESEYVIRDTDGSGAEQEPHAGKEAGGRGRYRNRGVRVSPERLDELVDLVGELVTVQAWLTDAVALGHDARVGMVADTLERLAHELRQTVLDIRMVPIGSVFGRFARYTRELSRELGKDVVLVTEGGATELDRSVIERIEEPLLHVIRNCIDHGIESTLERRLVGKPERGTITLSAYHAGGSMFLRIADDGRGLDLDAMRARAGELGLPVDGERESSLVDLAFRPGFSTASQVTSVSGRGVGLDVVKRTVEDLQGSVELQSRPGEGLAVVIRLPLTLAIIDGLLVALGSERYVVPASMVEACVELRQGAAWSRHGRDLVDVRGETLPFVRLREFFGVEGSVTEDELVMVSCVDGRRFGLVVDEVLDRLPVVIKTLGRSLRHVEGVLGGTMLGDGSVALIVDVGHVYRLCECGEPEDSIQRPSHSAPTAR